MSAQESDQILVEKSIVVLQPSVGKGLYRFQKLTYYWISSVCTV